MDKINRRKFLSAMSVAAAGSMTRGGWAQTEEKKYKACVVGGTKQRGYGHSLHMSFCMREDVREATESLGPIAGDCVHAMYGFPNGVAMQFDSVKNPDGAQGRYGLDVYGSRGIIAIRFDNEPRVVWLDDATWVPKEDRRWQPLPEAPAFTIKDPVRERNPRLIDDLIAAIEEDRDPKVSLEDGRAVQEMIQAVFESHVQGGRVAMLLERRSHPLR